MSRRKRWTQKRFEDGYAIFELSSWKYFHDFIRQEMMDYSHYVWRGQRDSTWKLRSSLDRALQFIPARDKIAVASRHLEKFKYASRGRRGQYAPRDLTENEWWALGQHHGLVTPLLDWTESPFVGLYFAFEKSAKPSSGFRSVWAIGAIDEANERIMNAHSEEERPPIVEFIRPLQEDNPRLVSQNGLFTRAPIGVNIEKWITDNFAGDSGAPLIQLLIPNSERGDCLRTLNNMNINHVTLFPDLYGAGAYCNKALEIRGI